MYGDPTVLFYYFSKSIYQYFIIHNINGPELRLFFIICLFELSISFHYYSLLHWISDTTGSCVFLRSFALAITCCNDLVLPFLMKTQLGRNVECIPFVKIQ